MDVIGKLRYLIDKHKFQIRVDGRLTRIVQPSITLLDSPWIHQYQPAGSECDIWHNLFFDHFKMVPSYCQNCWKVVLAIPDLVTLFNVYEIQHELERACKCGLELRRTDEKRYGGYFYNWGQEAGQECYKIVRAAMPDNVDVILKCSCSEYEDELGPPAEWKVTDEQKEIEGMFKQWVVHSDLKHHQPTYLVAYRMLNWIHHACHIGDLTYLEFTNGEHLVKTKKTYHKEF